MKKGDIVLLRRFPVLHYRRRKNRPALVLIAREHTLTAAFISSKLEYTQDHDMLLTPDESNGLKKTSVVQMSMIGTLDKRLVIGKLGSLNKKDLKRLEETLLGLLEITPGRKRKTKTTT